MLEKVAVIVATTVLVLATTVAYSEKLKFATWASAISVKKSSSSSKVCVLQHLDLLSFPFLTNMFASVDLDTYD